MSMDPYGGMYEDPGALGSAAAMNAQAGLPGLPMQIMNASPGIFASMGYSSFRGRNTLLKGGSRPDLFRTSPIADDFFGLGFTKASRAARRADKLAAGKTPFFRRAMQQRNPLQFSDLSIFSGNAYGMGEGAGKSGLYSPFGGAGLLGNTKAGRALGKRLAPSVVLNEGEKAFGPGLFAFMGAGTKIDRLERRAAAGNSRAAAKLGRVNQNVEQLLRMNNPGMLRRSIINMGPANVMPRSAAFNANAGAAARLLAPNTVGPSASAISFGASQYDIAVNAMGAGQAGVRGNLMASSAAGGFTQHGLGYARGALGYGGEAGLFGRSLQGAEAAEKRFATSFVKAFGDSGFTTKSGRVIAGTEDAATAFLRSTGGKAFFREIGASGVSKLAGSGAAKMMAMRGAALAVPGLQVLAAVSFAYDIGRMLGTGIKAGIDFARDAGVSLRGTIDKPAFGMGYRDTEAAATSRARGVMAIQNSRLNMRSLLGSEAGMMAAHYG